MHEGSSKASFFNRRSQAPRPLSEATETTEIYDTEPEMSGAENGSPRLSVESVSLPRSFCLFQIRKFQRAKVGPQFGKTSDSTASSYDVPTPSSTSLSGFDFQLGAKPVEGPKGPHLFRSSSISSQRFGGLRLSISSLPDETSDHVDSPFPGYAITTDDRPCGISANGLLQVNTINVRSWSPSQVASWMYDSGFDESIVEKFRSHDITGAILVDLQFDDLKELDIPSFGKRHRLWTEIHNLRGSSATSPVTPNEEPRSSRSSKGSKSSKSPSRHRQQPDCLSDEDGSPVKTKRSRHHHGRSSRRHRKQGRPDDATISPLESVSIVGIEQLLPKPHKCSKGERCTKYRKQQRQLALLDKEHPIEPEGGRIFVAGDPGNPETAPSIARRHITDAVPSVAVSSVSDVVPSVVASSDVLGPEQMPPLPLQEDYLHVIQSRDPQENVKQFLDFQHLQSRPEYYQIEEPPTPPLEMFPALHPPPTTPPAHEYLKCLPKLQIPQPPPPNFNAFSPNRTAMPSGSAPNVYRFGTPCSEMDVPVTAIPLGPIARDLSQSAPPEMSYRRDFIPRSMSAVPTRRPSFAMAKVDENRVWQPFEFASPVDDLGNHEETPRASPNGANHAGWMKKRKTRLLRHEWHEHHFRLNGTRLAMHKDERTTDELDHIDVDDFAVACSSLASNTKLAAAFKSMKLSGKKKDGDETAFSFQLIPAPDKRGAKQVANGKTHHFAVKTRDQRIDWMRELMLAKALKQKSEGYEINVNGNMI
ncbi:hypothetical protein GP486_006940 [Trichoglossum hirsutum]|uniref:SAM and PH domain-containing protein n=1 Tax=Trichoglossum hirsutum TaxID=265104 RepID=A0A9P8IIQ4_9PEZI|nr:hypothetical protein GP486_006940 [Trichoglossum hirsutum]